uniref:Uncharacterized protein n=1 Tax=Nelumbo nucifera TaxID=4432 RepID=A0A822ZIE9_NELNU|nr:TPA_asm: hypothetical protein HUJ06_002560 [Nelumbo nucifera]
MDMPNRLEVAKTMILKFQLLRNVMGVMVPNGLCLLPIGEMNHL